MEETRFDNGMFRIASEDIEKPRDLTPPEKVVLDKKQTLLAEKAEFRQYKCWHYGCDRTAHVWVREVGFDFKGEKAAPLQHIAVSSGDYPGPVPGFCIFHLNSGPEELAEKVYFDRPEVAWGVTPTRWWVSFTDGTRQGGSCIKLNEQRGFPNIEIHGI